MLRCAQHDRSGALSMKAKGRSRGRFAAADQRGCAVNELDSHPSASSAQASRGNDPRFKKASVVWQRLVECKHCALRVCQDCPAANFLHCRGGQKGLGAQFLGLGGRLIAIRDQKIQQPVSGNIRTQKIRRGNPAHEFFPVGDVQVARGIIFALDNPPSE